MIQLDKFNQHNHNKLETCMELLSNVKDGQTNDKIIVFSSRNIDYNTPRKTNNYF